MLAVEYDGIAYHQPFVSSLEIATYMAERLLIGAECCEHLAQMLHHFTGTASLEAILGDFHKSSDPLCKLTISAKFNPMLKNEKHFSRSRTQLQSLCYFSSLFFGHSNVTKQKSSSAVTVQLSNGKKYADQLT